MLMKDNQSALSIRMSKLLILICIHSLKEVKKLFPDIFIKAVLELHLKIRATKYRSQEARHN